MIDVTKPLQLSDGTAVTFDRFDVDGHLWVRRPDGKRISLAGFSAVFAKDGSRPPYYGPLGGITLQNVPEVPAFDPSKPVQTRDGRPARILATDLAGKFPIAAAISSSSYSVPTEIVDRFLPNGQAVPSMTSSADLVNVEPENVDYLSLGNGYLSYRAAAERLPGWPVVKVVRRGDAVVSAEIVTA